MAKQIKKLAGCECYIWDGEDGNRGVRPVFKTPGAACADVAIPAEITIAPGEVAKVPLNISFDIPDGWCVKMYPRSSLLVKHKLMSPVSIVDSDYKGIVHVPLMNLGTEAVTLMTGERVAQVECVQCGPRPDNWIEENNVRDQEGFGGSGRV